VQREDGLCEKRRGGEGGKMSPNFLALTHMEIIFPLPALPVPSTLPLICEDSSPHPSVGKSQNSLPPFIYFINSCNFVASLSFALILFIILLNIHYCYKFLDQGDFFFLMRSLILSKNQEKMKYCVFSIWIYLKMYAKQIFCIITPVFSVAWSFRNHSNMMMMLKKHLLLLLTLLKMGVLLNIFVEAATFFRILWIYCIMNFFCHFSLPIECILLDKAKHTDAKQLNCSLSMYYSVSYFFKKNKKTQ